MTAPAGATGTPTPAAPQSAQHGPHSLRSHFQDVITRKQLADAYAALADRHRDHRRRYLGFPVADDVDFPLTRRLLREAGFLNNISTTSHWPPGFQHAMEAEERVLDWLADHVGIPSGQRWGHLTTGGSGGNRAGIRTGMARYPDAVLLYSSATHYSVQRAALDYRLPAYQVPADPAGRIDLAQLDTTLGVLSRGRPAGEIAVIVIATYGTTLTEASDDLPGIHTVLDAHHIHRRYVHLDAALAGIPIALDHARPFDGADSISVSGYKFLAVRDACGIVIGRGPADTGPVPSRHIPYTDTIDATETGVRSGLHAALLLESIITVGDDGHRHRAHRSRELADHTIEQLQQIGVPAWRNPEAYFTALLPTPPQIVLDTWVLANHPSGISHVLTMPGTTQDMIDAFVRDVAQATAQIPRQRRPNPFAMWSPGPTPPALQSSQIRPEESSTTPPQQTADVTEPASADPGSRRR